MKVKNISKKPIIVEAAIMPGETAVVDNKWRNIASLKALEEKDFIVITEDAEPVKEKAAEDEKVDKEEKAEKTEKKSGRGRR